MPATISRGYVFSPAGLFIHDRPSEKEELMRAFRDALQIFQMRIKDLGNLDRSFTTGERESIRLMLEALLEARGHIDAKVI